MVKLKFRAEKPLSIFVFVAGDPWIRAKRELLYSNCGTEIIKQIPFPDKPRQA